MYCWVLNKDVWHDLGLNPGLLDHWRTLYPLNQWTGLRQKRITQSRPIWNLLGDWNSWWGKTCWLTLTVIGNTKFTPYTSSLLVVPLLLRVSVNACTVWFFMLGWQVMSTLCHKFWRDSIWPLTKEITLNIKLKFTQALYIREDFTSETISLTKCCLKK